MWRAHRCLGALLGEAALQTAEPPSGAQLFFELSFLSTAIIQRFSVDEFNLLSNVVDSLDRYQRGAVGADKAAAKHTFQFMDGGIGFVGSAIGKMDDRLAA